MSEQLSHEVSDKAMAQAAAIAADAADEQASTAKAVTGKKSRKAAKGKERPKAKGGEPPPPTPPPREAASLLDERFLLISRDLCRGSNLLLTALGRAGLLPAYDSEFMPLHRRFDRRFAPFGCLARPPPLTSVHFGKSAAQLAAAPLDDLYAHPSLGTSVLPRYLRWDALPISLPVVPRGRYRLAAEHFKSAKMRIEALLKAEAALDIAQRADAVTLKKVAVANAVFIAALTLRPPAAGTRAKCTFATHPHFVVVERDGEAPDAKARA